MEETSDGRKFTTVLETDSPVESEQATGACRRVRQETQRLNLTQETYERKGRSVFILSVEEGSASGLQAMDNWPSAVSASLALGYTKYNAVAVALSTAKRMGNKSATLKGVEFCYAEDLPGSDRI